MINLDSKLEGKEITNYEKRSNKKLARPEIKVIPEIDEMIETKENVYVTADWHLWKHNKQKHIIEKGRRFKVTIKEIEKLNENDLLIFLGDIADDEFEDKEAIAKVLDLIKCKKIMVLGNNDLLEKEFYEEHFDMVVEGFQYKDIIFTHFPIPNLTDGINIHGHLHGGNTYFENCPRSIDCFSGGRFKKLNSIIDEFNKR